MAFVAQSAKPKRDGGSTADAVLQANRGDSVYAFRAARREVLGFRLAFRLGFASAVLRLSASFMS
jgi:hypothetical protein